MTNPLTYVLACLRRSADNAYPWSLTPTEAGALVVEFERLKKAFNAADTLCVEIGYALGGKEVPKDKDELLDRVVELRNARRLDNEALTHAWDESRDMERAKVVAWLRQVATVDAFLRHAIADNIERGEHRWGEKP